MNHRTLARLALYGAFALGLTAPASAQSVEEFYKGKTLEMVIGYSPGGSNDAYARIVATHIGKHIPGNPHVVPKNMPGGGSLIAANFIANVAPKDGTVLGLVSSTIPLDEQLSQEGFKFKSADFNWIGRVASNTNVTMVAKDAPAKKIEDLYETEVPLAATGASSTMYIYPTVLNNVLGMKFDVTLGYEGAAASMLALERGEVQGVTTSWAAVNSSRPDWVKEDGPVNFLVQFSLERLPGLSEVPTAVELARDDDEKRILKLVVTAAEVGKSVLTTPGVPEERVAALRKAFDEMVEDPDFVKEIEASRLGLEPMTGTKLQAVVAEVGETPKPLLKKVAEIWPNN